MRFETQRNTRQSYVFRKSVPAGESGFMDIDLVEHGYVDSVRIRFAAGEGGTLQVRPVIIIPQEIQIDLFKYPKDGDKYVTGDDETIVSEVQFEIENHAILRVYYNNTGDPGTVNSQLNVDIGVTYFQITEPENIIGPRRW